MRTSIILFFILCLHPVIHGQNANVLTFDEFMELVKTHHPISKAAQLQLNKGDEELRIARGSFDPTIDVNVQQKYFDGKQYYDLSDGKLKVPTWFGIELEGGYEQNQGLYLNPQNRVPEAGLWYTGISIPLGEGLFIDKRRNMLRKAQVYQASTRAEQTKLLNELMFEAGKAYWSWFEAYNKMNIYEEALDLALERFNAVQTSAQLGDIPLIDTLESGIQVQNRHLFLQEAQLSFLNEKANLSVYLWLEGNVPLELEENTSPSSDDLIEAKTLDQKIKITLDTLINNHPDLQLYRFKLEQLKIEERWKREQIKPEFNLKYNPISEPINNDPFAEYSLANYKWGLEFSFPLFLRKERGELNLIRLSQQETNLEYELKRQSLIAKAQIAMNEWETTKEQHQLYSRTRDDYLGLLNGERQLFNGGESSLFLVNSRELGYINAQIKLIELLSKNQKAQLKTAYALGILGN